MFVLDIYKQTLYKRGIILAASQEWGPGLEAVFTLRWLCMFFGCFLTCILNDSISEALKHAQ